MVDRFGAVTAWLVILGASPLVIYHFAGILKHRRMEIHDAAMIMLGTGFVILTIPQIAYQNLPPDAQNAISWIGILTVLLSIALDAEGRRRAKRDQLGESRPEQPVG